MTEAAKPDECQFYLTIGGSSSSEDGMTIYDRLGKEKICSRNPVPAGANPYGHCACMDVERCNNTFGEQTYCPKIDVDRKKRFRWL